MTGVGAAPPEAPLTDPGNTLLSGSPFSWATGKIPMATGEAGVFTLRTVDVTLTLGVTKDQLNEFIDALVTLRDSLSGSGLVVAGPTSLLQP